MQRKLTVAFLVVMLAAALIPQVGRAMADQRSSQQDAVEQFYVSLHAQDYQRAYDFFSARYRASHPYAGWAAGYANTNDFDWRSYPTDTTDTVGVDIISDDSMSAGMATHYFSGVWHLARGDAPGGWNLDSAEIGDGGPWASPGAPDFTTFADGWWHHDYRLTVRADGTATAWYRTASCSFHPTPPCDYDIGNSIIEGGHLTITFTSISGSTAYGSYDDGGQVTLTLLPYDMALLQDDTGEPLYLCGSQFAQLAPATVVQWSRCGA